MPLLPSSPPPPNTRPRRALAPSPSSTASTPPLSPPPPQQSLWEEHTLSPPPPAASLCAALYAPRLPAGQWDALLQLAQAFSPVVEPHPPHAVVCDISGLSLLFGSPHEIAHAMARRAGASGGQLRIAVASSPDVALLVARHCPGVHVLPPGEEADVLAPLPVAALPLEEDTALTLERWGIRTLGELARLPLDALTDRLGQAGAQLWRLARGGAWRALHAWTPERRYTASLLLDDPLDLLDPLLFLLSRLLHEVCAALAAQALAARALICQFDLAALGAAIRLDAGGAQEFRAAPRRETRTLELPVPLRDPKTLLKLLQLELEARPLEAPVHGVTLEATPAPPRSVQHHFYLPPSPEPVKLEITLARIAKLVGRDFAGSAALCDTHQPGAFRMVPFRPPAPSAAAAATMPAAAGALPRLVLRRFRPPLPAVVTLAAGRPAAVQSKTVSGAVERAAGPWRSSGDWWRKESWSREEWDVALASGSLYRLCRDASGAWFVEGIYD